MMNLQTVRSVKMMVEMAQSWSFSRDVAFVPTMGYLHEGHLALVREAAARGRTVVVSIFVNPLQFGPAEDFEKYPRDLNRDACLLEQAGAHYVFAPQAGKITPKDLLVHVDPGSMGGNLCGQYRPGHFTGVCTIVLKLFNIVRPGIAVFGWKDAQQFLILRKMCADLNVPVELVGMETTRDVDGLAMSSRNSYLTEAQRRAAPTIYGGLCAVVEQYKSGTTSSENLLETFRQFVAGEPQLRLQYASVVSMDTLEPVDMVTPGNTLIAVAVYAGETRLIDNIRL